MAGKMATSAYKWSYVFDEPTRILVVDDDPILREFAVVHLSAPLCEVECAPDGIAALAILADSKFDLVTVDIDMPGMDGFELVRRIRATKGLVDLPVVVMTGREDIPSIDQAYAVGATSFATKPINWRHLSYQLRYVIRSTKVQARQPRGVSPDLAAPLRHIIEVARRIAADANQHEDAHQIAAAAETLLQSVVGATSQMEEANPLASLRSTQPAA
jgi:CheY-like chemotaxis protein